MLSIIICSRNKDIPNELKQNIDETIGCDYELVVIDNSANNYSIFEAYNDGVRNSTGDLLCFCHDDIVFRTSQWGVLIRNVFSDGSIGQIGVAGSHFLPNAPMYWWSSPYISQYNLENDKGTVKQNDTRFSFRGHIADVAVVDGVCFFIPKSLFVSIRFDDLTYKGFHAYDMDISMQVQKIGKRVCVTDVLTIEHFWSEDSLNNKSYMKALDKNLLLFHKKWENDLPMIRGIDEPEIVFQRLNNLCIQAYEAIRIRKSKAYRLGKFLLKPIRAFK